MLPHELNDCLLNPVPKLREGTVLYFSFAQEGLNTLLHQEHAFEMNVCLDQFSKAQLSLSFNQAHRSGVDVESHIVSKGRTRGVITICA